MHWLIITETVYCAGDEQWLGCYELKTKPSYLKLPYGSRARTVVALSASPNSTAIPRQWYNLIADLPIKPPPSLHPKTFEPVKPEDLSPLFPDELIKQEASNERFIDIPEEVLDVYSLWRPTPLIRLVLLIDGIFLQVNLFCKTMVRVTLICFSSI